MNVFGPQQTAETISANNQLWTVLHTVSDEQHERQVAAYQAEKTRLYKIRLINAWRAKEV